MRFAGRWVGQRDREIPGVGANHPTEKEDMGDGGIFFSVEDGGERNLAKGDETQKKSSGKMKVEPLTGDLKPVDIDDTSARATSYPSARCESRKGLAGDPASTSLTTRSSLLAPSPLTNVVTLAWAVESSTNTCGGVNSTPN